MNAPVNQFLVLEHSSHSLRLGPSLFRSLIHGLFQLSQAQDDALPVSLGPGQLHLLQRDFFQNLFMLLKKREYLWFHLHSFHLQCPVHDLIFLSGICHPLKFHGDFGAEIVQNLESPLEDPLISQNPLADPLSFRVRILQKLPAPVSQMEPQGIVSHGVSRDGHIVQDGFDLVSVILEDLSQGLVSPLADLGRVPVQLGVYVFQYKPFCKKAFLVAVGDFDPLAHSLPCDLELLRVHLQVSGLKRSGFSPGFPLVFPHYPHVTGLVQV